MRRILLAGLSAEITAPAVPFGDLVDFPFRCYAVPESSVPLAFRAEICAPLRAAGKKRADYNGLWGIKVDGQRFQDVDGAEEAVRWGEVLLLNRLIHLLPDVAHIHGGVVANSHQSLVLIGDSGAGKSTLSVALSTLGYDLFTDDVALIARDSLRPLPVPRPVKLDEIARALLAPMGLQIEAKDARGESVIRSVIPGLPPVDELGPPVGTMIFLAGHRAVRPALRRLTAAEAAMRLVRQSASERMSASGMSPTAQTLVERAICYELVSGPLDETARLVASLGD